MNRLWIIVFTLCVSAWESAAITNKGRPSEEEGVLRNFRHVAGHSSNVNTDWEVGLREAVNQALLRERYHEYNLRERLFDAPLIGKRNVATPFGDIIVLARGQLYVTPSGSFLFVQDQYQNDCDYCHNSRPRCSRSHCQVWQPDENEHLVALWTVKRLRHRNHKNGFYYELEYTVSPITPAISEFVTRNGYFDYAIPGHIFVVKNDKVPSNEPVSTYVSNKHIHHHHVKPDIVIGISPDGERHILHSYPGFYTSLPVHPTYHQNKYSTNDPREIELYKQLIESLAAKTSSTQKAETDGPYKFSLNDDTEAKTTGTSSTRSSYDSFPTNQHTAGSTSTTVLNKPSMPYPYAMTMQQNIITKPSIVEVMSTKPTELNPSNIDTMYPKKTKMPGSTQAVATTIHYFTPIGEEELITDGITEMKKIMLETTTVAKKPKEPKDGLDFLFPIFDETTTGAKPTKNYYKPTVTTTQDEANILEEPASSSSSSSLPTKQYHTTFTESKPLTFTTTNIPPSTITTPITPSLTPSVNRTRITTTKLTTSSTTETTSSTKIPSTTAQTKTSATTSTTPKTTRTMKETPSSVKAKTTTTKLTTIRNAEGSSITKLSSSTIKIRTTTMKFARPKTTEASSTSTLTLSTNKSRTTTTTTTPTSSEYISTTRSTLMSSTNKSRTTTTTPTTSEYIPTTRSRNSESTIPKTTPSTTTQSEIVTKVKTTPKRTTEVPSTTPIDVTTTKLKETKTKQSNFTGFITASLGTANENKITTYKPTIPKLTTASAITKLVMPITITSQPLSTLETARMQSTLPTTFVKVTSQTPMIDLDYTFLEDIIPTKPMSAVSLKPQDTETSSSYDVNEATRTTTISTQESKDTTTETTLQEASQTAVMPSTKATSAEVASITPSTQMTTNGENKSDEGFTSDRPTQSVSDKMLDNDNDSNISTSTAPDTEETEILKSTIITSTKPENMSVLTTVAQESEATLTTETSTRKPTTSTTNIFLTEEENTKKPDLTKPISTDFDEDDIFGTIKTENEPTKSTTVKDITESDIASELFGGKRSPKFIQPTTPTVLGGTEIIFSDFFEASTTSTPPTTEFITQAYIPDTTENFMPLTSQSYTTSIGSNNKVDVVTEYETSTTTTNDSVVITTEMTKMTTESASDTKMTFDRLALQVINHAKSIDYLSVKNKTSKPKYRRRKLYVPKNRRNNKKKNS